MTKKKGTMIETGSLIMKYIINDEFHQDNTHRGPTPAWQDPTGLSDDPIVVRNSIEYVSDLKQAQMHIRYSHDFENKTEPININKKFFVVVGTVGFFTEDIIKELPFNAIPVPRLKMKLESGPSIDAQANLHILKECNEYAKAHKDIKGKLVADRWLLNSIVESPETPCLWDKAYMNPYHYAVLVNKDTEEVISNQKKKWIETYNKIMDEEKNNKIKLNKRLYTELELKYKKKNQITLENYAYDYLGSARKDCYVLRCEGLEKLKIVDVLYKLINGFSTKEV